MLRLHVAQASHPDVIERWFPPHEPDPFFEASVLRALYGDHWISLVVEEGRHALRHAFAVSPIGSTGLFDIEPLLGYNGPLATPNAPPEFLVEAIGRYSAFCREHAVVAEVLRFNPILENDRTLEEAPTGIAFSASKPVVYLPAGGQHEASLSGYPAQVRNKIRAGNRQARIAALDNTPQAWTQFRTLYKHSLEAVGASPEWSLTDDQFERMRSAPQFTLIGALQEERLVAASVALIHGTTSYCVLAARMHDDTARRGVRNAVVHEIARRAAETGGKRVGLGGGNSSSIEDSLFRFKRSFGGDLRSFRVGLLAHNRGSLDALIQAAERSCPGVSTSALFLRYRLAPGFSAGRMEASSLRLSGAST